MKLIHATTALLLSTGFAPALSRSLRIEENDRRLASCLGTSFSESFTGSCSAAEIANAVSTAIAAAGDACTGTDLNTQLILLLGSDSTTLSTPDLVNAALDTYCASAYEKATLPFWKVTRKGDQFDREFMNGGSDWNDQYEIVRDGATFHILAEDTDVLADTAAVVGSQPIEFPTHLTNFQNCAAETVMCCYVADRQADADGTCAAGEECIDADPDANTDICYSDMSNARVSNRVRNGLSVFDLNRAGENAEGPANCQGFHYGQHDKYAGNLLFNVFEDNLLGKGYVNNVPGAPMCACIEQMPVVEYADCSDITSVTETFTVSADDVGLLSVDMTNSDVSYGSCGGLGLAEYAMDTHELDISSNIVGQGNCSEAVEDKLASYGYARSAAFEILSVESLPEGENRVRVTFSTKPSATAADISSYTIYKNGTSDALALSHATDFIDTDYVDIFTSEDLQAGMSYQLVVNKAIPSRVAEMVRVEEGFAMAVTATKWEALSIGNNFKLANIAMSPRDSAEFLSISSSFPMTSIIYRSWGSYTSNTQSYGAYHGEEGPTFSEQGVIWGDKAVQIGPWRIRQMDDMHLSVSHKSFKVGALYKSDGYTHYPSTDYNGWDNIALGEPSCAYLTEKYLQIGDWRFAEVDSGRFVSVSHKGGKTNHLYEFNGRVHGGPRLDRNSWTMEDGEVLQGSNECFSSLDTGIPNVITIGNFKIAQVRSDRWLSVSSETSTYGAQTSMIYERYRYRYGGPRQDYNAFNEVPISSDVGIQFGDKTIQIGVYWRIRQIDDDHLSISHSAKTGVPRVFRSDGHSFDTTNLYYSGFYNTALGEPSCAYVSENYIRVGDFRIGLSAVDSGILSVTHINGITSGWFRIDGKPGDDHRLEFNSWNTGNGSVLQGSSENCNTYHDVEVSVSLGPNFKLAKITRESSKSWMTLSSNYHDVNVIYENNGSVHLGPRWDQTWNAFVRGPALSEHGVEYGDKTVQFVDWRIRQIDINHLSLTYSNGKVVRIFRSDGTVHGSVSDFSGYKTAELGAPTCAYLSENYLQIGDWRIGAYNEKTVSVSHKDGFTSQVFTYEGFKSNGPFSEFSFSSWKLPKGAVLAGSDDGCDDGSVVATY